MRTTGTTLKPSSSTLLLPLPETPEVSWSILVSSKTVVFSSGFSETLRLSLRGEVCVCSTTERDLDKGVALLPRQIWSLKVGRFKKEPPLYVKILVYLNRSLPTTQT